MNDDIAGTLNVRAYLALRGSSLTPTDDIVALLKSDVPIERWVRDRMAELLNGSAGDAMKLALTGNKPARDRLNGGASRHQRFDVGHWINIQIERGEARTLAIASAAKHFNISCKKADASIDYYRRAEGWILAASRTEAGEAIGAKFLKALYISHDQDECLAQQLNASLYEQLPPISVKLE